MVVLIVMRLAVMMKVVNDEYRAYNCRIMALMMVILTTKLVTRVIMSFTTAIFLTTEMMVLWTIKAQT